MRSVPAKMQQRYRQCLEALRSRGQEHLLRWWDELEPGQRDHLLGDVEALPWDVVDELIPTHVLGKPRRSMLNDLAPPKVYPQQPRPGEEAMYKEAVQHGRDLIRAGKVAAFTVAGGQGTRLGFDGPKGAIAVSPVRDKTLFQLFAEMIGAANRWYGLHIPWYIMTGPANHEQTIGFLEDNGFFGLRECDVTPFSQAVLPVFDFDGRILLQDKHRIALAPDGHGGSLKALVASGALEEMRSRGFEIISYCQVDNPLVKPFDPLFLGLHAKTGSEMSSKVTPKADDFERVGNLCLADGRLTVIEYTEFPKERAVAKNPDGSRRFNAGNAAIHALDVAFVERVIARSFDMPVRRAEKAVPFVDEKGVFVKPSKPNAVKLETFVFDVLPLAESPLLLEIDRAEEFSPVKNPVGVDSLETAKQDQVRRACRWLEAAGAAIPRNPEGEPDLILEIAPAYALDAEDVKEKADQLPCLTPGQAIYLE